VVRSFLRQHHVPRSSHPKLPLVGQQADWVPVLQGSAVLQVQRLRGSELWGMALEVGLPGRPCTLELAADEQQEAVDEQRRAAGLGPELAGQAEVVELVEQEAALSSY
jgi:hypothetical protein